MGTRFYLLNNLEVSSGTLPNSSTSISATTPSQIGDSGNIRRALSIIGVNDPDISVSISTAANQNAQPSLIVRFVSDPIKAQTFSNQTISIHIAAQEGAAASNFLVTPSIAIWRPSTGSLVGRISDLTTSSSEPGTSETALSFTIASTTQQTSIDQDVLIFEIWRDSTTQSMSTSYSNAINFSGNTVDSTTSNAAYIEFGTTNVVFQPQQYAQTQALISAFVTEGTSIATVGNAGSITLSGLNAHDVIIISIFSPSSILDATYDSISEISVGTFTSNGLTNKHWIHPFHVPLGVSSVTITIPNNSATRLAHAVAYRYANDSTNTTIYRYIPAVGLPVQTTTTGTNPSIGSPPYSKGHELYFGSIGEATATNATPGNGYHALTAVVSGSLSLANEYYEDVVSTQEVNFTNSNSVEWEGQASKLVTVVLNYQLAQAQAQITGAAVVAQIFGQAQTDIKAISLGFGQAQADIKAIISTYGQAQANIKAVIAQFAQAQATIATTEFSFAQANAYIYIPQIARPIADISNTGWLGVVI